MVLDSYRQQADRILLPLAQRMSNLNPDALTWASLAAAAAAAPLIFIGGRFPLLAAFALILASALLDALDGKIARITSRASLRGDFLDHTIDRYADILILGGVMFSPFCPPLLGFVALVGVFMTSYMGTQAQAVGLGRLYAGYLGRADRLVILLLAVLLQAILDPTGVLRLGLLPVAFTLLGWAMVIFATLGNATAVFRAVRIWRGLARSSQP